MATATVQALLRSRVVAALASPHGVDRYLELVNPMWAATEVRARVVDVHRENPGSDAAPVATLTLQPTSTWRGHRAGQYVQVGVDLPGSATRQTRCFTVSSAASAPGEQITLTVRAHAEGQVSRFLATEARPGQMVHLSQAEGDFTLEESPATPTTSHFLFVTAGSGITPAMAILRTLLRDGLRRPRRTAGHVPALRPVASRPDLRRRARRDRGRRQRRDGAPAARRRRAPADLRAGAAARRRPASATSTPGSAAPPASWPPSSRPSTARRGFAASSSSSPPSRPAAAPRATSCSRPPARRRPTPAPPCSSRPRPSA